MLRIFAVIAAIVAVVLFAGLLIFNPSDPTTFTRVEVGGFLALAASLGLFELEGARVP